MYSLHFYRENNRQISRFEDVDEESSEEEGEEHKSSCKQLKLYDLYHRNLWVEIHRSKFDFSIKDETIRLSVRDLIPIGIFSSFVRSEKYVPGETSYRDLKGIFELLSVINDDGRITKKWKDRTFHYVRTFVRILMERKVWRNRYALLIDTYETRRELLGWPHSFPQGEIILVCKRCKKKVNVVGKEKRFSEVCFCMKCSKPSYFFDVGERYRGGGARYGYRADNIKEDPWRIKVFCVDCVLETSKRTYLDGRKSQTYFWEKSFVCKKKKCRSDVEIVKIGDRRSDE